ncbi:MADF domain-containing protein [Aphis craccivora]|uniref:MADF domain-containing protein n=1 Tax=Aphis craccivora TaxID=307492 RepID=A0A6G0Y438_APHCR|nr:MADF domain-containing protein [Aphis craccivora]
MTEMIGNDIASPNSSLSPPPSSSLSPPPSSSLSPPPSSSLPPPPSSSQLPQPSLSTPNLASSKKRKKPEDPRLDKAFELLTAAASATNADESQNFGDFVANKLRKYSARTQSAIQHAFMGIFLNADNGMYEQPLIPQYTFDYPSRSTTANMSQDSNLSSPYSTETPTPEQVCTHQVDDGDILNYPILN